MRRLLLLAAVGTLTGCQLFITTDDLFEDAQVIARDGSIPSDGGASLDSGEADAGAPDAESAPDAALGDAGEPDSAIVTAVDASFTDAQVADATATELDAAVGLDAAAAGLDAGAPGLDAAMPADAACSPMCQAGNCGSDDGCGGTCTCTAPSICARDGGSTTGLCYPIYVNTTIPIINNSANSPDAGQSFPNPDSRSYELHFVGVVTSPLFLYTADFDGADYYCLMGVYMADPNATTPVHNGVLVTAEGTAQATDAGIACNYDSELDQLQATGAVLVPGEELSVSGGYWEICRRSMMNCVQKDTTGRVISIPEIVVDMPGGVQRTGNTPGVPSYLPVSVDLNDISSAKSGSSFALGSHWRDYRAVLVKTDSVDVVDVNNATCEWTLSDSSTATYVIADDQVASCQSQPPCQISVMQNSSYAVTGFVDWHINSLDGGVDGTRIAPRGQSDL